MALVTTKEMFKKAYEGHYAIGAFNINNMEIIQAITEAAAEVKSPVVLQVSAGARKYAKHAYLMALAALLLRASWAFLPALRMTLLPSIPPTPVPRRLRIS